MTWSPPALRLPAMPLKVTALVTALLLAAPALVLLRMPRPRAEGLGRLLTHAALLQSFPAAPDRQPPPLWDQRLDAPTARLLWRQQRQLWWQFWSHDEAGGAYLAMPLPRQIRVGAMAPPPHSLQIDGLLVVSSGPLAKRFLEDQLVQASRRPEGLRQRCLVMLEREPGAFWSARGLEAMAAPIAPLLQALQEGCVALELEPGELLFSGEAGRDGDLPSPPQPAAQPPAAQPTAPARPGAGATELPEPIGEGLLLRLHGRSLDLLLDGLLSRAEVREAVQSVYGLGEAELALLRNTPFELRLRPQLAGPFQAGLELSLLVQGDPAPWIAILDGLSDRLRARALVQDPAQESSSGEATWREATWRDAEGREVGGWRWLLKPDASPQLLLFLGPQPETMAAISDGAALAALERLPLLSLQVRPQALAALNLLPGQLPLPLLQARQLLLVADDGPSDGPEGAKGISQLWGRLQLGDLLPIQPPTPAPSLPPTGQAPPGPQPSPPPQPQSPPSPQPQPPPP